MSSANKTSNLQLNQWVASDPVLRTDFNSDNAKLDASIGSISSSINTMQTTLSAMPYRKLTEVTFTSAPSQVDVNLGANMWDYSEIIVVSSLVSAHTAEEAVYVLLNSHGSDGSSPYVSLPSNPGTPNTTKCLVAIYAPPSVWSISTEFVLHLGISKAPSQTNGTIYHYSPMYGFNNSSQGARQYSSSGNAWVGNTSTPINTINFKSTYNHQFASGKIIAYGLKP